MAPVDGGGWVAVNDAGDVIGVGPTAPPAC